MATGPEHYREAERLVALLQDRTNADGFPLSVAEAARLEAAANIHAQLAVAAATAMAGRLNTNYRNDSRTAGMHTSDSNAWDAVAGEPS